MALRKREWAGVLAFTAIVAGLVSAVLSAWGVAHAAERAAPAMTIEYLVDRSRMLSLDDVAAGDASDRFSPLGGNSLSLGFTRDAAWLRLTIQSRGDATVFLSLAPNFVDELDVYVMPVPGSAPSQFLHFAMGDHRPISDDALSGVDNVVPLDLVADETKQVFIRMAAVNSSLTLTASLYSPARHTLRTTVSGLALGVWFGGMAVQLVIQLVFFYFDRKPYFVLLAISTFTAMLVYMGTLGLSRLFLFPDGGVGNDMFTAGTSWFGLTTGALAAASILELPQRFPWLNRIFLAGAAIGLVGVGFALAGANLMFANVVNTTIIVLTTLGALQSLRAVSENDSGSRLRAGAFCVLWLGIVATIAQRTGIGSLPDWVAHGYAVSCLIHTILLTGALGVRLRAAETMNRIMREEALVAAQAAEKHANMLVEEKTSELATAKQVAEEALRAELASQQEQVRFMEVISHQYRTPLAAIRSHVDNIDLSLAKEDNANRRRIDRIRRGIARLVEVLEVNLSRSRLQGPSFRPELVRQSPAAIVTAASARARDLLQSEIVTEIDPEARQAQLLADFDMLEIAIINLLENAVKYARIGSREPVVLRCFLNGPHAVILVKDNGIGIPAGELGTILAHSVRGSNVQAIDGTGTGLSLVSRIAAAHRGRVKIQSVEGQGTTVKIILPLLRNRATAPAPA
ncbi:sensor histidine kinase [Pseudochelatococcus sp. B33]